MSPLLLACLSLSTPAAALGLRDQQASLERWDHDSHAQD
jgi:hypothetical protein